MEEKIIPKFLYHIFFFLHKANKKGIDFQSVDCVRIIYYFMPVKAGVSEDQLKICLSGVCNSGEDSGRFCCQMVSQ